MEIQRKEMRNTKKQTVCCIKFHITKHDVYFLQQLELLSKGINKPIEELEKDINRPKYFNPWEAVDYGLIDKVNSLTFHLEQLK